MTDDLWDAYLATHVRIEPSDARAFVVHSTHERATRGEWPFAARDVWILTACNPRSELLSEQENAARHARLGEQLDDAGYVHMPAHGFAVDGSDWHEPGFAVLDAPFGMIEQLAGEWEQNAVFHWRPDGWTLVGILLPGRTERGWRIDGPERVS